MNRAERRRIAAAERKAKQRWARSVRRFNEETLGAFDVAIIRPVHLLAARHEPAVPLLWGWYRQASAHPSGPLCLDCDAELTPPTARCAWLLVSGAVGPAGSGLVTGICRRCPARSDAELLRAGLNYLRRLWPDLREGSPVVLLREMGRE